jgi:futalosine hydrolase
VILIACAVGKELAFLRPQPHVELLVTGVGPVEAAAAVSRALAQSSYDLVISAGIAGAFEGAAEIGEGVVVADEIFELDLETAAPIALPDGARVIDRAASDIALVDRLIERGFRSVRGVTVPRVTATDGTAARLGAFGSKPLVQAAKMYVSLGQGEYARVSGLAIQFH